MTNGRSERGWRGAYAQHPCKCADPACVYRPWSALTVRERAEIALVVIARDGRRCWLCGLPILPSEQVTLDHVVPDSAHGGHDPANLRPAHAHCNYARGNRPRRAGTRLARADWYAEPTA